MCVCFLDPNSNKLLLKTATNRKILNINYILDYIKELLLLFLGDNHSIVVICK